jgi:hypothetical protein
MHVHELPRKRVKWLENVQDRYVLMPHAEVVCQGPKAQDMVYWNSSSTKQMVVIVVNA